MTVIISGSGGITDVNGTAAAPAITGTDTDTGVFFGTNTVSLSTGGTERLQVDSSGNLGLGVTPAAKFNIGAGGAARFNRSDNATYGEVSYGGAGVGMKYYDANSDGHRFFNGATQALTLNTSGYLGIGTSSPTFALDIATTNAGSIAWQRTGVSAKRFAFTSDNSATYLRNETDDVFLATFQNDGNLCVGTTSNNNARLNVVDSTATSTAVLRASATGSSYAGNMIEGYCSRSTTNGSYQLIAVLNGNASGVFVVRDSGNCANTNNSYGGTSDIKLKENIIDTTPKLEKLCQVRVVNYNFKEGQKHKQIGVIAQELEQVFPGMVEETPDYELVTTTDEDGNETKQQVATGTTTKSVKYSVFVPMLIKALQEQQAIITQLQADVAALKGQA